MTYPREELPGSEFGFMSMAAYRKFDAPATFSFFKVTSETGGIILTGSTSSGVRKTGKNKGRPRWDGPRQMVIVTDAEVKAEETRYESESGNCHWCYGSSQQWLGWSAANGHRHGPCSRCKGTGKACTK